MQGFVSVLYYRHCCGNCKFTRLERCSDFTLADFWGISLYNPEYNDKKGTSLFLINTPKAQKITKIIKDNFTLFKKFEYDLKSYAYRCNNMLVKSSVHHHHREQFFNDLNSQGEFNKTKFDDLIKKWLKKSHDIGIVGYYSGMNYGTHMTYYALYKTIKDMGYSSLMINQPLNSYWRPLRTPILFSENPYPACDCARVYNNKEEMRELNKFCDKFITGSDQYVRPSVYKNLGEYALLDWADDYKPKFGYSISFGEEYLDGSEKLNSQIAYLINKYDKISVRETSGVKLCKEKFNKDVIFTLGPVFLLDLSEYQKFINKSKKETKNKYLLAYLLDKNEEKVEIAENLNMEIEYINNPILEGQEYKRYPYVEDWLKCYQNADFVLTDSFHGVCMALIFKKQFAFFYNKKRGASRFDTLIECFNISDRIIETKSDILRIYNSKIDYDYINKQMEKYKIQSVNYLKEILGMQIFKPSSTYDFLKEDIIKQESRIKSYIGEYLTYNKKSNYYKFKYQIYRLLLNFTYGKTKNKVKEKKNKYKRIKEVLKRF